MSKEHGPNNFSECHPERSEGSHKIGSFVAKNAPQDDNNRSLGSYSDHVPRTPIIFIFFLFFFAGSVHALEQTPYPFSSNIDAHRFELLTKEVRCVVCQNQNLADSNAPLANDLREKIYRMVLEQKSNEEIKDYLVKRYGEFILLQPRFNNVTLILWAFPFLGLTTALLFLIRLLK